MTSQIDLHMTSKTKVFYIEDEPDIREIVCMALELADDIVSESIGSGHEALQRVQEFKPDVILLDVMMPEMDGPTTLQELRKIPATADTPVVFTTAKVQRTEVDRLMSLGAIAVIPKPFDPLTLAEQVKDILQRHHG